MTKYCLLSASVLMAILTVSVSAQRTAAPPSQPASTPQANATLPTSKIALIYSDAFLDPKTGIAKFNVVLGTLNREFQKQKDDLTQMQQRSKQLQDEITKLQQAPAGTPIDQKSLQTKIDQLDQLKKDFQRKGEDAQAAYKKRREDVFEESGNRISNAPEVRLGSFKFQARRCGLCSASPRFFSSCYGNCSRFSSHPKSSAAPLSILLG